MSTTSMPWRHQGASLKSFLHFRHFSWLVLITQIQWLLSCSWGRHGNTIHTWIFNLNNFFLPFSTKKEPNIFNLLNEATKPKKDFLLLWFQFNVVPYNRLQFILFIYFSSFIIIIFFFPFCLMSLYTPFNFINDFLFALFALLRHIKTI